MLSPPPPVDEPVCLTIQLLTLSVSLSNCWPCLSHYPPVDPVCLTIQLLTLSVSLSTRWRPCLSHYPPVDEPSPCPPVPCLCLFIALSKPVDYMGSTHSIFHNTISWGALLSMEWTEYILLYRFWMNNMCDIIIKYIITCIIIIICILNVLKCNSSLNHDPIQRLDDDWSVAIHRFRLRKLYLSRDGEIICRFIAGNWSIVV